ncbi:hypothetical protein LZ32DRAFT_256024 [Colletotrichum eremochloae]|nr:hypothetical protein LZ32DRAFT_256024 [Colletotrichum eremochloae]
MTARLSYYKFLFIVMAFLSYAVVFILSLRLIGFGFDAFPRIGNPILLASCMRAVAYRWILAQGTFGRQYGYSPRKGMRALVAARVLGARNQTMGGAVLRTARGVVCYINDIMCEGWNFP